MVYVKPKHNTQKKVYNTLLRAYENYPKLSNAFSSYEVRIKAIEMTVRFYGAYAFKFGKCISSDDTLMDIAMYISSSELPMIEAKKNKARCYSRRVVELFSQLEEDERILWDSILKAIEKSEEKLELPNEYIYLGFLAVEPELQKQGKGTKLLDEIKKDGKDIILFTNTDELINYYKHRGFEILEEVCISEYEIRNTYMIWRCNEQK